MTAKPNLIVAGVVKGGTTSLFRYLNCHPSVCGSKVKEACYFLHDRYGESRPPIADYFRLFDHCRGERYLVEATPGYLDGGRTVAEAICRELGSDVKILFCLRAPHERLASFFRYKKAIMDLPKDMAIEDYLEKCKSMPVNERSRRDNDAYWGIDGGRYINYLQDWFDVFGKDRILVVFFDDLAADPRGVMTRIADWLQIDRQPFLDATYAVENRTVPYRYGAIHRLAIWANMKFEPLMRKLPRIKSFLRGLYYRINSAADDRDGEASLSSVLAAIYADDNRRLARFLTDRGYDALPNWLDHRNG